MTFTNLSKTESQCDTCKERLRNHWQTKQRHLCFRSETTNTEKRTA